MLLEAGRVLAHGFLVMFGRHQGCGGWLAGQSLVEGLVVAAKYFSSEIGMMPRNIFAWGLQQISCTSRI